MSLGTCLPHSNLTLLLCQDKLANFRIKELKDVLTQLGLAKQGKKQVRSSYSVHLIYVLELTWSWEPI